MEKHKVLTVVLTDFSDLSSHDGISFNKERVNEYINSSEFIDTLNKRHLLGLLTHGGRTESVDEIPEVDYILKHKDFCNIIVDTWIDGNQWLADVQLVETEAAERLEMALEAGIKCGVSIVVDVDSQMSDGYLINKLYGVDFTLDPAFGSAQIIKKNFSKKKKINSINVYCKQFSFRSYERDMMRDPAELLHYRIRDVTNILRDEKSSKDRIRWSRDYVLEPLYKWLRYAFKNPGIVNISLGLRLNRWVPSSILTDFNSVFNRLKRRYEQDGTVSISDQRHFKPVYFQMIDSLLEYIEKGVDRKIFSNGLPSSYLNRLITSLYEYMNDEKVTMKELQERLEVIVRKKEEEGLDDLTLFDDYQLEEYVWYFFNTDDKEERRSWFNKILHYLDSLVKF